MSDGRIAVSSKRIGELFQIDSEAQAVSSSLSGKEGMRCSEGWGIWMQLEVDNTRERDVPEQQAKKELKL